jgi:uncharacterized protein YecT (DUF1311 family)
MRLGIPIALVAALSLAHQPARADSCDNAVRSEDIARCLAAQVRAADERINSAYRQLLSKESPDERLKLRDEERAWITERDAACAISERSSDREQWYAELLVDYRTAVCATHYALDRAAELERRLSGSAAPAAPAAGVRVAALPAAAQASLYNIMSRAALRSGKWYFEVTIDPARISATAATALWWGCRWERDSTGSITRVHAADTAAPTVRGSIALDLDAGKLYVRRNGVWLEGAAPGSSGGNDVTPGRPYRCGVETTLPVGPLLDSHQLRVNFGDAPFDYALPEGYRPLSSAADDSASAADH